jgi:hypothetical protein
MVSKKKPEYWLDCYVLINNMKLLCSSSDLQYKSCLCLCKHDYLSQCTSKVIITSLMVFSFSPFFYILLVTFFIILYVFLLLCIFYYYVMCSFVSLSILIVMYVPFCVFCLIVLFCVLFVCKCVLYYCHRDIRALFDYPNWGFSMHFPSVVRQMPGYNSQRQVMAHTSQIFIFFLLLCMFHSLYSVYCLCVNVYCTTATGCQPNYRKK